jgi:hypothetical protein
MPPDQLLSTHAAAAVLYREAVVLLAGGRVEDARQFLRAALLVDDRFAIAHAALAITQWELGDEPWAESIACALGQRRISRRERQHVAVVALVLEGQIERASALGCEHLQEFPTDHAVAYVLARSGSGREHLAR